MPECGIMSMNQSTSSPFINVGHRLLDHIRTQARDVLVCAFKFEANLLLVWGMLKSLISKVSISSPGGSSPGEMFDFSDF